MSIRIDPSYSMSARFKEAPPALAAFARSNPVILHGLTKKEVNVFTAYFMRQGAESITVSENVPFSFREALREDFTTADDIVQQVWEDDGGS